MAVQTAHSQREMEDLFNTSRVMNSEDSVLRWFYLGSGHVFESANICVGTKITSKIIPCSQCGKKLSLYLFLLNRIS